MGATSQIPTKQKLIPVKQCRLQASVRDQGGVAATLPPADPAPPFDTKEYPPGTVLPTPRFSGCGKPHCKEMSTPRVELSPLAQLQSFPLPRYHSPPAAGGFPLQKLGNCGTAST